jgi:hypothetical protein
MDVVRVLVKWREPQLRRWQPDLQGLQDLPMDKQIAARLFLSSTVGAATTLYWASPS